MTLDCTKPGYYRTRDGRIAKVAGNNKDARLRHQVVGWLSDEMCAWHADGSYSSVTLRLGLSLVEYLGPELPKPKRKVKVAPALFQIVCNYYYITHQCFSSETEARSATTGFIRWLIDTPYALEVEVDE